MFFIIPHVFLISDSPQIRLDEIPILVSVILHVTGEDERETGLVREGNVVEKEEGGWQQPAAVVGALALAALRRNTKNSPSSRQTHPYK